MELKRKFGQFGGQYIPESLIAPLNELEAGFLAAQKDPKFLSELETQLRDFAGRETPITFARNLSESTQRNIYLKREDLLHGGAHKTNNAIGQALLAQYLGKTRIIAETGAGSHGVATAMIGAVLGIPVEIFMGKVDMERQSANVARMNLFGAKIHPVTSGSGTLKDAINATLHDWIQNPDNTYYVFGTAAGPHPYPSMVRYFQSVIGTESRRQMLEKTNKLPDGIFACIGGGSNAIGIFSAFIDDKEVKLYGAEPMGKGDKYAASLEKGSIGVFHGMLSYFLQDEAGQIQEAHSISAGLDYPGIGPEHAYLYETGRAKYLGVTDQEALDTYRIIAKKEGIIAALESCHAIALALREAPNFPEGSNLLISLSGRGDKDLETVQKYQQS